MINSPIFTKSSGEPPIQAELISDVDFYQFYFDDVNYSKDQSNKNVNFIPDDFVVLFKEDGNIYAALPLPMSNIYCYTSIMRFLPEGWNYEEMDFCEYLYQSDNKNFKLLLKSKNSAIIIYLPENDA